MFTLCGCAGTQTHTHTQAHHVLAWQKKCKVCESRRLSSDGLLLMEWSGKAFMKGVKISTCSKKNTHSSPDIYPGQSWRACTLLREKPHWWELPRFPSMFEVFWLCRSWGNTRFFHTNQPGRRSAWGYPCLDRNVWKSSENSEGKSVFKQVFFFFVKYSGAF